jgi:hypothetical protein
MVEPADLSSRYSRSDAVLKRRNKIPTPIKQSQNTATTYRYYCKNEYRILNPEMATTERHLLYSERSRLS